VPQIIIFAIGAICTLLCVAFYGIYFVEVRRINRQYEERREERERIQQIDFAKKNNA
jgi:hypothetical protein